MSISLENKSDKNPIKLLHLYSEDIFKKYICLTFENKTFSNDYIFIKNIYKKINFDDYAIVFVHSLNSDMVNYLNNNIINIPVVWFFYGADGFVLGKFYNIFLENKTKFLRARLEFKFGFRRGFLQLIKCVFPLLMDKTKKNKLLLKQINKFRLIVPVMPNDFLLLKENYHITSECFHLNYINPVFLENTTNEITGNNILLGNSASFANNHIEAIDILSKMELLNRNIIIPLNYGNSEIRNYISTYAKKRLGENHIEVLETFIPFDEYHKIILSCDVVIMNHKRQQALGNIVQALISGAHLFLNSSSPIFQFLTENDFYVTAFNDKSIISGLEYDKKIHNYYKTIKIFGPEKQRKSIKLLINKVIEKE